MFLNIVCLCAAAVCVFGAPSTDVVPLERRQPTVIPIVEQSEEIEANGTFKYSYETGNGIKREEVSYDKVLPKTRSEVFSDDDEDNNNEIHVQQGSYSYTAPDGTVITVRYIADENGFRPIGDHLPKPPSVLVATSASKVSGRRSKTVDSDAGGSSISAIATAPIVVADAPLAPASGQSSNAPENLEVKSRIADTSVVQASVPKSVPASNTESGAQESSVTPQAPSTTEVLSTADPSTSTTESATTVAEQVSTSEVTSTELVITAETPLTSEASSESSTTEELASTPNATPESTLSLDSATEAATTAAN